MYVEQIDYIGSVLSEKALALVNYKLPHTRAHIDTHAHTYTHSHKPNPEKLLPTEYHTTFCHRIELNMIITRYKLINNKQYVWRFF